MYYWKTSSLTDCHFYFAIQRGGGNDHFIWYRLVVVMDLSTLCVQESPWSIYGLGHTRLICAPNAWPVPSLLMLIFVYLEAPPMQYSPWPLLFISGFHHKCLVHKFLHWSPWGNYMPGMVQSMPFGSFFFPLWQHLKRCFVLLYHASTAPANLRNYSTEATLSQEEGLNTRCISLISLVIFMGSFSLSLNIFHNAHDTNFHFIYFRHSNLLWLFQF